MTCIVCGYEFCWHCLDYAGNDANHFSAMNPANCGIGMMDKKPTSKGKRVACWVISLIMFVIFMPVIAVLWFPAFCMFAGC